MSADVKQSAATFWDSFEEIPDEDRTLPLLRVSRLSPDLALAVLKENIDVIIYRSCSFPFTCRALYRNEDKTLRLFFQNLGTAFFERFPDNVPEVLELLAYTFMLTLDTQAQANLAVRGILLALQQPERMWDLIHGESR